MKKTILTIVSTMLLPCGIALSQKQQENLVDQYVNILAGTRNDGAKYSRGNQYPAVTVPFGMNAWSPVTQAPGSGWYFDFRDTSINAIKLTHQPSPWVGDHAWMEFFPMTGSLRLTHTDRASDFNRTNEFARPYQYRNHLGRYGIWLEVVPTSRCAFFNITYPASASAYMLLQTAGERASTIHADQNKITGWVKNGGAGVGRLYFCAVFSKKFVESGDQNSGGVAYVKFSTKADETVNMRVGTSYFSEAQAEANLNAEIGNKSFEQVRDEGRNAWNRELNKITVAGGTEEERTIFYSCFYRGLCFPKAKWETVNGVAKYHSPYDGKIHDGKIWIGNGFWDTFRCVWPFFTIIQPTLTGEMLDGWVNSYKDGGWTVNWSAPGYLHCMIGTHADSLFADAFLKGIRNFDYEAAYKASYKNGTVQGDGARGRPGLNSYISRGYVPADETVAATAKTMEYSNDDFCISQFAKALGKTEDAKLFAARAMNYTNVFSSSVGFFRGRKADGSWRTSDADFHPNEWGHEWIEGCAWQYIATPMQDGAGLARLYGGREGLEKKIDALFGAPPDFRVGSYGGTIHEMQEAYDIGGKYGFGQYAHGNQPVQHTIYMYNHAGKPSKTQYWIRKAMRDLYESGRANGHGYCGDEDNGQTSLWYVMSAMGFYSATPGFPEYTIGSPIFDSVTIRLENGQTFTIEARNNSNKNIYIQSATLNGKPYTKNYFTHATLMAGGTQSFEMGDKPSGWGTKAEDLPSSLSSLGISR
jgi:predicted alpha-1,2-mannosidase